MTSSHPLISVVIPIYKVEEYLERCVTSVREQTYSNLEILLVDYGSPDGCGALCDRFAEEDARIRALHKPNGGLSDARNFGMEAGTGDYFLFVDSDDYIDADMVETLYRLITQYEADLATCGVYNCYPDKTTLQYDIMEEGCVDGTTAYGYILEGKRIPGTICNKLIPRHIMESIRFPVGRLYEDAFITADLMPLVNQVAYTTQPKYYYFHRAGSITTTRFKSKDMDVIAAYDKNRTVVENQYPSLKKLADFRVIWAHFVVLDRMLAVEEYQSFPEFKPVVDYLKKRAFSAAAIPHFTKGRRAAALALRCSLSLYRKLMLRYQNQVAQSANAAESKK